VSYILFKNQSLSGRKDYRLVLINRGFITAYYRFIKCFISVLKNLKWYI